MSYLNDANAGALWGHYAIFGANSKETSISIVIGTGNGGGIILDGEVVKGKNGFGGELGHVLIPYQSIASTPGIVPNCNCGRVGDLESLCSLTAIERTILPYFLPKYPGHELGKMDIHQAAKQVRGLADKGDPLCKDVFRVQAHALGLFFDEMINTFDPDALDRRRRRPGNQQGIPGLVHERDSRGHAAAARRAGQHSHSCDAQRRHRRRARRGHRGPQTRPRRADSPSNAKGRPDQDGLRTS